MYFSLYRFYKNKFVTLCRVFLALFLIVIIVFYDRLSTGAARPFLSLSFLFILNEWFVFLKINRTKPPDTVEEAGKNYPDSILFPARLDFLNAKTTSEFIKKALSRREVQSLLRSIGSDLKIPEASVAPEKILDEAADLVRASHGKYISHLDLFVAYLLLAEKTTRLLEGQELTSSDVENLYFFLRNKLARDEKVPALMFLGYGVFDFFVYGWNAELQKYALDKTARLMHRARPPVFVGRADEFSQLIVALTKGSSNNVILVGEPGVGKSALVDHFAYASYLGLTPPFHKKVYEVLVDQLIAGVATNGELEERLGSLILDIAHAGNVVVFIQNIENIFGGGGFQFDMSGMLAPYLENARIPIIGTATPASYKVFLESKPSIKNLFDVIRVDAPDEGTALFMVMEAAYQLAQDTGLTVLYSAVAEAVALSASYLPDSALPGRAITLLEDVTTTAVLSKKRRVDKHDVREKVEEKTKIILDAPTDAEKNLLLHLEDELHKRIIDQKEAVSAIGSSLRRLRSGFIHEKRPISVFLFLGPTGVGKTETARALAALYFGNEKNMIRLDMSEYQTQDSIARLLGGGDSTFDTLADAVRHAPFSLILLDEFEKAHPHILDLFLQVFDEGRLTDARGHTVSFLNTIIIATSNAGSELIREKIEAGAKARDLKPELLEHLLKESIFKPELLNRFDEVVVFEPLSSRDALSVARLLLSSSLAELGKEQVFVSFDDSVLEKIVREGYDAQFGARNMRRYIESVIEEFLSQMILRGSVQKGSRIALSVDPKGEFIVE